jgi:hypothetical protein
MVAFVCSIVYKWIRLFRRLIHMWRRKAKRDTRPVRDVVEYVDFVMIQPLHKRMDKKSVDLTKAMAVARTLLQLAGDKGSKEIQRLAHRIWMLALQSTTGDIAPPRVVEAFLRDHNQQLAGDQCDVARQALEGFTPRPNRHKLPYVEYRGRGGAEYLYVGRKKRWPKDDLTFRLVDAYWALKEAGCRQCIAVLARRLTAIIGKKWTWNMIESRIKPYKTIRPSNWLHFPWRERYWLYVNRASEHPPRCDVEQPFVFTWSDGSEHREPDVKPHDESEFAPWVAGIPSSGKQ